MVDASSSPELRQGFEQHLRETENHVTDASPLRDAALIESGNLVEHYEMAAYGTLVAWARQLGFSDAATLLQQTLEEEKAADAKLTQLGEKAINPTAAQHLRAA